jgi:PAS domain S-box-containing protein
VPIADIICPDSKPQFIRDQDRVLSGKRVIHRALHIRHKNGRAVVFDGFSNLQTRSGTPLGTYSIFRPFDHASQEEELDRLFNLSLDLLCIAGVDGYFKRINPAFVKILGYNEEELLSRSFLEFVHPDDRESTLEAIDRLAQGLLVVDFVNRYQARDGRFLWIAWRSAPWAERGLIYAVARDITEQRQTHELLDRQRSELARSNADLEQFANMASHDLRAPLRHVANLAAWIEEDMPRALPEKVRENLENLRSMVHRMEKLTDDILRYSRVGREPEEVCLVDTAAMLEELVILLSPPEGIRVTWDPGMPTFTTAKSPLEQVFRNIIGNAIQHHHRQEGNIRIVVDTPDDIYQFGVIDDGPGIPSDFREKIFAMFQKGPQGDKADGSGFGLALVKRIIESHGGSIWVDSVDGGGSAFRFTWPKTIKP